MKPFVLILIDACPSWYLQTGDMSFTSELVKSGVYRLVAPLFAFRGIEATLFSGKRSDVHGVFTEFVFRGFNQTIDFRKRVAICGMRFAEALFWGDITWRRIKWRFDRWFFRRPQVMGNMIPASVLKYFEPALSQNVSTPGALPVPTIFDHLFNQKMGFIQLDNYDNGVTVDEIKGVFQDDKEFAFWYIKLSNLDAWGHRLGPDSAAMTGHRRSIDGYVREIVELFKKHYSSVNFLIIADHEMVPVRKTVNVVKILDEAGLKQHNDYNGFFDSTMVRLWCYHQAARDKACSILDRLPFGTRVERDELKDYSLPTDRQVVGDVLYCLSEGQVVMPNYFQRKQSPRGMHGYPHLAHLDDYPFAAYVGEGKVPTCWHNPRIDFTDAYELICQKLFQ